MLQGSPSGSMSLIDWKKIGVGALIAISGTLLTYITQVITGADFGVWTPLVVSAWSIISNIIRKYLSNTQQ